MHKMTGVPPGLLCMGALLALLLQGAWAESIQSPAPNLTANQNSSLQGNITPDQSRAVIPGVVLGSGASRAGKVLRAGFQKNRTINDLDVYGNRSVHDIPPQVPASWAFEIGQRVGNVSIFNYTSSYKPLYSMSQYSRTKAVYQAPSTLSSRPVYSISGYPWAKIASIIP